MKWLSYVFREDQLGSFEEIISSKKNLCKILQMVEPVDHFKDILEIAEHVSPKDILKEVFTLYSILFQVRVTRKRAPLWSKWQ